MHDFLLKQISSRNLEKELLDIGYDKTYAFKGKEKFEYLNFKIFDISPAQGNIIKQLALSTGADCATHRDVITGKVEFSNCILGGNISQLRTIAQKLKLQPFSLKNLGEQIEKLLNTQNKNQTKIMGILNITPDSFSDGGNYYKKEDAIRHLQQLIEDGADIIDIGAESTRPYSQAIDAQTQLERLLPILEYINKNDIRTTISIDTRSAEVAQKCIELGASIINDVSGFDYDKNMADIISKFPEIKIIIQHSKGTPENMQDNPQYNNLMDEIFFSLKNKVDYAISKGILAENIIIDPGIGFGKTKEQNFEILNKWQDLKPINKPILIGLSRKSLLGMEQATNDEKDLYTLALNSNLINNGIDYIRVHNVKIHKKLIEIIN